MGKLENFEFYCSGSPVCNYECGLTGFWKRRLFRFLVYSVVICNVNNNILLLLLLIKHCLERDITSYFCMATSASTCNDIQLISFSALLPPTNQLFQLHMLQVHVPYKTCSKYSSKCYFHLWQKLKSGDSRLLKPQHRVLMSLNADWQRFPQYSFRSLAASVYPPSVPMFFSALAD